MSRKRFEAGFTLIEIIVVVIILGILAGIALPPYQRTVEKGRTAEARNILGRIRSAEIAYYLDRQTFTNDLSVLGVPVATGACNSGYYFVYNIPSFSASDFTANAQRCTAGGKAPDSAIAYNLNITATGTIGGTAGYV